MNIHRAIKDHGSLFGCLLRARQRQGKRHRPPNVWRGIKLSRFFLFVEHRGFSAQPIGNFHQNHNAALGNCLNRRVEASGMMDCMFCFFFVAVVVGVVVFGVMRTKAILATFPACKNSVGLSSLTLFSFCNGENGIHLSLSPLLRQHPHSLL